MGILSQRRHRYLFCEGQEASLCDLCESGLPSASKMANECGKGNDVSGLRVAEQGMQGALFCSFASLGENDAIAMCCQQ
jgi:hypothetical protein